LEKTDYEINICQIIQVNVQAVVGIRLIKYVLWSGQILPIEFNTVRQKELIASTVNNQFWHGQSVPVGKGINNRGQFPATRGVETVEYREIRVIVNSRRVSP